MLDTQPVEIPFTGGLDTKSDEKLVLPGKLTVLENGVFTKRGAIKKRHGYDLLPKDVLGSTALTAGEALGVSGLELLLFNKRTAYGWSANAQKWIDKGRVVPCVVSGREILRNNYQQTNVESASANGITIFAWSDSRGGVRCTVIDDDTGAVLLGDQSVNTTAGAPKCIAIGNYLHIFYPADSNTDIRRRTVNTAAPGTLDTEVVVRTDLKAANPVIDVTSIGARGLLAYNDSGRGVSLAYILDTGVLGSVGVGLPDPTLIVRGAATFTSSEVDTGTEYITLTAHGLTAGTVVQFTTSGTLPTGLSLATDYFVLYVDADTIQVSASLGGAAVDLTAGGSGTHTITPQGDAGDNSLSVVVDDSEGLIYLCSHNGTNGLRAVVVHNNFVIKAGPLNVSTSTTAFPNMTGVVDSGGGSTTWYGELTAGSNDLHLLYEWTVSNAAAVSAISVFKRGLGLASKAFLHDSIPHVVAVHDSSLQATFFALDSSGNPLARISGLQAAGVRTGATLPAVRQSATGVWKFPLAKKTRILSSDNDATSPTDIVAFTLTGAAEATLDFTSANRFQGSELEDTLHVAGGFLSAYDGQGFVEHGFFLFPEGSTTTPATSGGSMADGTYSYKVSYEWTDNQGNLHRSAPSPAVSAVVSGGGGSGKVTVTVPSLRITAKTSPRGEVELVLWRTQAGGTIYQRAGSLTSRAYNDTATNTVAVVDTISDTTLQAREYLYTEGGVLDNNCPPPASLVSASKTRLFLVDAQDPTAVWFSKEISRGEGVAFSEFLKVRCPAEGGAITAIAVVDDKVVLFKKDSIFAFAGSGPNDLGAGTQFPIPDKVSSDVGCATPASITECDDGLLFKSNKGIYQITRGLELRYTGEDVEGSNSLTTNSGVLLGTVNEVRFTASDGATLVYHYLRKQWGTFTGAFTQKSAVSAALWDGTYAWLASDGSVYTERGDSGRFRDDATRYSLKIQTAWISLAGLQGYQRVKRALLIGNKTGDHILQVQVGVNYEAAFPDLFAFNTITAQGGSYWGSSSYWGGDSVWGGVTDALYQWEMHMVRQKCMSIRFLIDDLPADSTDDAGYEILGLSLQAGFKRGLYRPRAEKRA